VAVVVQAGTALLQQAGFLQGAMGVYFLKQFAEQCHGKIQ
jgi:hypothetical protein